MPRYAESLKCLRRLIFEFDSSNIPSQSYIPGHIHRLAKYYTLLWRQLTCPHPTTVRFHIYEIVIFIEKLILLLSRCNRIEFKFHQPIFPFNPSETHQIVYQPTTILDLYLLSLRQNYYYPLASEDPADSMMDDITTTSKNKEEKINTSSTTNPSKESGLVTSQVITVEHSLEIISDLISEIEAEDPPTQTQEEVIIENPKQATYKYRFSLYKKSSVPVPGAPTSQLKLFQSSFRSVKATDHSAKILAIRSDVQIYPLTTTDQIMNLEHTSLFKYFKPNKRSQKTIAGDFFVQTKHTFEAFLEHPAMNTWLMQFGYIIAKIAARLQTWSGSVSFLEFAASP
jgi:hypothetical protein